MSNQVTRAPQAREPLKSQVEAARRIAKPRIRLRTRELDSGFEIQATDPTADPTFYAVAFIPNELLGSNGSRLLHAAVREIDGALSALHARRHNLPMLGARVVGPDGQVGHITMIDHHENAISIDRGPPLDWSKCAYDDSSRASTEPA